MFWEKLISSLLLQWLLVLGGCDFNFSNLCIIDVPFLACTRTILDEIYLHICFDYRAFIYFNFKLNKSQLVSTGIYYGVFRFIIQSLIKRMRSLKLQFLWKWIFFFFFEEVSGKYKNSTVVQTFNDMEE